MTLSQKKPPSQFVSMNFGIGKNVCPSTYNRVSLVLISFTIVGSLITFTTYPRDRDDSTIVTLILDVSSLSSGNIKNSGGVKYMATNVVVGGKSSTLSFKDSNNNEIDFTVNQ